MMPNSPLFSATLTTSHPRRTYIGPPSEFFLYSDPTNKSAFLSLPLPTSTMCWNFSDSVRQIPIDFTFGQRRSSALQTSEEKYYNYGTNSYCDYVILPNSVEVPMLETDNIQHHALFYHSTTRAPPCSTHVPCLRPIISRTQFSRSWVSVATRTCEDLSQHPSASFGV